MDPYGKKGIFVGYCEVSKSFKIYISRFHHIDICRDVTFDEEINFKKSIRCQLEEVHEEDVPPKKVEAEPSPEIVALEYHDMLEPQESPTMDISRKRKPSRVIEIIQEAEKYGALEGSTRTRNRSNPFSSYVDLMCDLVDQKPNNYEENAQKKEWVEAMMEEYQ